MRKSVIFISVLSIYFLLSCSVNQVSSPNENGFQTNNEVLPSGEVFVVPNLIVGLQEYYDLNSQNYQQFPIELQPYEVKIIYISNLGKSGAVDTDPSWYLDAVFYQIFVRSFYDSNGDGKGDLNGIIQKLDYITNIGFNAVWLLPIFESPSYHGYDATDYYSIESDYGNLTSFQNFLSSAHNKGVRVILDMVLNHTSSSHPWFQDSVYNRNGKGDWYVWTNVSIDVLRASGWQDAWGGGDANNVWHWNSTKNMYYYGAFWSGMPDLNLLNPAVSNEMFKIGSNWLAKGVDGYRLDAVRYLVETGPYPNQADTLPTKVFLQAYNQYLKSLNPNFYTVGEVWENNGIVSGYYGRLDSCFNFDFAYSVRSAIISENPSSIVNMINTKPSSIPWKFFAPFIDNHDDVFFNGGRLADQFNGSFEKQKLASAILLTFPGTPFVYYGSEIGMMKGPQGGDEGKRTPMQWDSSSKAGFTTGNPWTSLANNQNPYNVAYQLSDPNSLLNYYKKLINIRKVFTSVRRGDFKLLPTTDSQVLSYIRIGTNESILVVANFSSSAKNVTVNLSSSGLVISENYKTYLFNLGSQTTTPGNSFIIIDGVKENLWNSCKVAGPITNTLTETKGWDFGGFLGLYITNDTTNLYVAFDTLNLAGQYGNTIYLVFDLPSYSYNLNNLTNNIIGSQNVRNVVFTNNFYFDFFVKMTAPSNSFVQNTNVWIVWGNGSYVSLDTVGNVGVGDRFVEISIPLSDLNLTSGSQIRVLVFFSGDNTSATAYCAIPFDNNNNYSTGGTTGPLPNPSWNSLTILDDYLVYTLR